MAEQCFCLRWNNFQSSVVGDLRSLLEQEEFVDVTLACEGRRLKAHRLMLSACSNYFRSLLKENPSDHPIIFLRDVQFWEIESIMDFIYNGEVNVMQDQLPGFIRTAEMLQIKGLAAVNNNNNIHPPKMYEIKQMHEAYMRHQVNWKDMCRLRPTVVPSSGDCTQESNRNMPLLQPAKRFRYDNGHHHNSHPSVLKENNVPKIPITDLSPKNVHLSDRESPSELLKKDTELHTCNEQTKVGPETNPDKRLYREMKYECEGNNEITSPSDGKSWENHASSRSGTPEEDRHDMEEDRSSHEGSVTSFDGLKDVDWAGMTNDQSSPLSISVNDAGLPVCKVCGKVFKHQGSLVAHYQVHQQRTKCPVCKKVLSRHYHMKVHLLTVHKVPDSEIEGLLRSQNIS